MNLKKYMNIYYVQYVQYPFLNQLLDTLKKITKLLLVLEIGPLKLLLMDLYFQPL